MSGCGAHGLAVLWEPVFWVGFIEGWAAPFFVLGVIVLVAKWRDDGR